MEHLLNNAPPDDGADEVVVKNEAPVSAAQHQQQPTLPRLASQLAHVASPSSSAASLGLHMLSVSAAAPPPTRLPPISLLTAAAAALQPMQCHPLHSVAVPRPQLRPMMLTPMQAACVAARPVQTTVLPPSVGGDRPAAGGDLLCRYRNKKCGYPRAIKRNGERHNLCERHRSKANQNQRKLESKRRTLKRMMQRQHGADRIVKAKKAAASGETEIKFTLYGGAVA